MPAHPKCGDELGHGMSYRLSADILVGGTAKAFPVVTQVIVADLRRSIVWSLLARLRRAVLLTFTSGQMMALSLKLPT